MPGFSARESPEARAAYNAICSSFNIGYIRLLEALIASSRLTLAARLTLDSCGPPPQTDESRGATILPIIENIGHEAFDSFRYIERVSHLVYAATLLDTFLLETTIFLFLLIPQSMGKSQQVSLKLLIEAESRSAALTQVAQIRAREVSFKSFLDRIAFLRETFGLNIQLAKTDEDMLIHYSAVRNSAIHDQGIFELGLDTDGRLQFQRKTCPRHPTQLTDDDPIDATNAFRRICDAIASCVFSEVLKCDHHKVLPTEGESNPEGGLPPAGPHETR